MKKVLVAGAYTPDVKDKITALLGYKYEVCFVSKQEELLQRPETDYLIQRILRMDAPELEAMPRLRFIQRWGAGYDTVDIKTAGQRGVTVANLAGANAPAVAEQAVNLMLAALRNTAYIDRSMRGGHWVKSEVDSRSYMIRGKTLGLLGAGNIGRTVAKIVQAFGAQVQYYDVFRLPPEMEEALSLKYVSFDELFETSDIISIHIPKTEENYHMIGAGQFAKMKPTAVFINTAHGGIVDETALYEALKENRILAAGIDCFEYEPIPEDHPLLSLDQVTVSCHVGGNTADIGFIMAELACANVDAYDSGTLDNRHIVNTQYLK